MNGLTGVQWLWTVLPGLITFLVNAILKTPIIKDTICPVLGSEDQDEIEKADKEYSKLKRNVSVSIRSSGKVKVDVK
jgi:hypothetical protein